LFTFSSPVRHGGHSRCLLIFFLTLPSKESEKTDKMTTYLHVRGHKVRRALEKRNESWKECKVDGYSLALPRPQSESGPLKEKRIKERMKIWWLLTCTSEATKWGRPWKAWYPKMPAYSSPTTEVAALMVLPSQTMLDCRCGFGCSGEGVGCCVLWLAGAVRESARDAVGCWGAEMKSGFSPRI
jgi:hypothetical protein